MSSKPSIYTKFISTRLLLSYTQDERFNIDGNSSRNRPTAYETVATVNKTDWPSEKYSQARVALTGLLTTFLSVSQAGIVGLWAGADVYSRGIPL